MCLLQPRSTRAMARCTNCNRYFKNVYQLGPHRRRCAVPLSNGSPNTSGAENDNSDGNGAAEPPAPAPPIRATNLAPHPRFTLGDLARRPIQHWGNVRTTTFSVRPDTPGNGRFCADYREVGLNKSLHKTHICAYLTHIRAYLTHMCTFADAGDVAQVRVRRTWLLCATFLETIRGSTRANRALS